MGGSRYSADEYQARSVLRAKTGAPVFGFHATTASQPRSAQKAHTTMDPKTVKNGIRESRDSVAHPTSKGVILTQDVTGSLNAVPKIVQANLPKLMGLLTRKGYLEHPHILVSAVGDAAPSQSGGDPDTVPLQIGQFESGIEIDNDITNLFLEGGGGGQKYESYDLAMYFMAYHTSMDCFEKRGERGYMFIIGDEMCRDHVSKEQVARVLGINVEADIPIAQVVKELERKFDVYFILSNFTSYYNDQEVFDSWAALLTNVPIKLEDPAGVSELIATVIGIAEGKTSVSSARAHMQEVGTELSVASAVTDALVRSGVQDGGTAVAVSDSGEPGGLASV